MFSRSKILVFLFSLLLVFEYSQDLQAKNKAPIINWPRVLDNDDDESLYIASKDESGRHCWPSGGASTFLNELITFLTKIDFLLLPSRG